MDQPVMELFLTSASTWESEEPVAQEAPSPSSLAEPVSSPGGFPFPVVGTLGEMDPQGVPLVYFQDAPGGNPVPARSVVPLDSGAIGREVVLLFEQGDPGRPLVMGVLRTPRPEPVRTEIDGEKLVLTAEREIVLRCGEASITLTRAGKVLIQGAFVQTKSSGLNRIKGAAVQIN
ncbi:MAG: hypothetical protein JO112_05765 [Planctomycetes bacterium]|nr:hypothetical protein [Planctomycetota bacterium]